MEASGGVRREVVRTLQTTDRAEAPRRRDVALAALRQEVDAALVKAKLRPLTDWTADWPARAVQWRRRLAEADDRQDMGGGETERGWLANAASEEAELPRERQRTEAMVSCVAIGSS
jgi:hypothetical protein